LFLGWELIDAHRGGNGIVVSAAFRFWTRCLGMRKFLADRATGCVSPYFISIIALLNQEKFKEGTLSSYP